MRTGLKLSLAAGCLLSLAACGSLGNPNQGNAGITHAVVKVCTEADKVFVCAAEIVDGKEKQAVHLSVKKPDGWEIEYSASGVLAFEAHKVRAAVDQAISADVREAVPDIVEKVTGAILKAYKP